MSVGVVFGNTSGDARVPPASELSDLSWQGSGDYVGDLS